MDKVFVVYESDVWHTNKRLLAVTTDFNKCIYICKETAALYNEILSEDDLYNLANIGQTQGYNGEGVGEFIIEEVKTNELI